MCSGLFKRFCGEKKSNISCCLAQSHIDSLHSTELCFLMCPAVSHTAASGTQAMLKLAIPSEIKKEKACIMATWHATHAATHSWDELPAKRKEYMTKNIRKHRLEKHTNT